MDFKKDLVLAIRDVLICGIFPIASLFGSPETYAQFEPWTIETSLLWV